MPSKNLHYTLILHLVVLIFGFTAILGKLISVSAPVLVWYRLLIAVLGIAAYLVLRGISIRLPPAAIIRISATGLLIAFHWVLFFAAIKASNVSITLVCLSVAPLIVAFIEPLAFGRTIRSYEVLFGLLAVAALGFIFRIESGHMTGIVLALSATLLASIFVVINARLVRHYRPTLISFYELAGGLVGLTLYNLAMRTPAGQLLLSGPDLGWLLVLGIVCTAFTYIAGVEVMKVISPYTVMLTVNLEPVYGIILALLIFRDSEYMQPGFYAGAVLILLTITGNGMIKRRLSRNPGGFTSQSGTDPPV